MYFINHTSGWIIIAPVIIPSPITHIKNSQIEPYEENKECPLLCSALWCQITGTEDALGYQLLKLYPAIVSKNYTALFLQPGSPGALQLQGPAAE